MEDLKRIEKIEEILRLIYRIWKKNPCLRLTQLLGNCFEAGDLYYKKDDILEQRLKEKYNEKTR